ncbi:glutathione S-transferase family protein [Altererythrobacter fulvus]|uniref:glutathione S-transferase family protein n=1 Tax=Caenibius fulvus TaxID=2126012 RepID=UPI003018BE34
MIRLTLGSGDASSFRLIFALEEIGLPYEVTLIDLDALEQWSDAQRTLSPTGAVPLLQIDDLLMEESDLALFFLAESNPAHGLLPREAAALYDCQDTIYTLDRLMNASGNLLGWLAGTTEATRQDYLARLAATPSRPVLSGWSAVLRDAVPLDQRPQAALADLEEGLDIIEGLLAKGDWLLGNEFSIADIAGMSLVHRLVPDLQSAIAPAKRPRIAAWMGRISGRRAYQKAVGRQVSEGISLFHSPPRDHL